MTNRGFARQPHLLLTKKGFETTIAASGEEAIEIIEKTPQDVVVLDVKMEGMDGHEALAKIKQMAPGDPGNHADRSRNP
jgi:CheY-like chemotaxis protein